MDEAVRRMALRRYLLVMAALAGVTLALAVVLHADGGPQAEAAKGSGQQAPAGFMRAPSGALLPRFASIATGGVEVRGGPSLQHPARWVIRKAGLPVEIVAEAGDWRRIRDHEGEEGWVRARHVSEQRRAMVAPWNRTGRFALKAAPDDGARTLAELLSGVVLAVHGCDGRWCRVQVRGLAGWMRQPQLWGVYAGERFGEVSAAVAASANR